MFEKGKGHVVLMGIIVLLFGVLSGINHYIKKDDLDGYNKEKERVISVQSNNQ